MSRSLWRALLLTAALMLSLVGVGRAQAPAAPALRSAEAAERALDFGRARREYERAQRLAPDSREARRAAVRLEWLAARHDPERGYEPLAALVRARRAPTSAATLRRFAEQVAHMPEGRVRRESLLLLAEGWHRRMSSPGRSIEFYDALLRAPGLTAGEQMMAQVSSAQARAATGHIDEAIDSLDRAGLSPTFEAQRLRARRLHARLRVASWVAVALALCAGWALSRPLRVSRAGLRRALGPGRIAVAFYALLFPAVLVELYQAGVSGAFLSFAAGALPLLGLTSIGVESLAERRAPPWRSGALLAAVLTAHAALACLALDGASALASFGL